MLKLESNGLTDYIIALANCTGILLIFAELYNLILMQVSEGFTTQIIFYFLKNKRS